MRSEATRDAARPREAARPSVAAARGLASVGEPTRWSPLFARRLSFSSRKRQLSNLELREVD